MWIEMYRYKTVILKNFNWIKASTEYLDILP